MEWTKSLPREPGFYWHHTDAHRFPGGSWASPVLEMVKIEWYNVRRGSSSEGQILFVESIYDDDYGACKLSEFKEKWHRWMGPVVPPAAPKSELIGKERFEYEKDAARVAARTGAF